MRNYETEITKAADVVRGGGLIAFRVSMGSCQCGDHQGTVGIEVGVVTAHCSGLMDWQCSDGPAERCTVPYGWGGQRLR